MTGWIPGDDARNARDNYGHGRTPPHPKWPDNARVAVSFVINFEEGAELALSSGDERNEREYEVSEEVLGLPDPCMELHFEYGTRAGYWRIADTLQRHGVVGTLNACGRAVIRSPWLVRDAIARGHEISCHGWRWETSALMNAAEERGAIEKTVSAIKQISGTHPVGWHTRSAPSANTRRLLLEHGGFIYDSDAYCDDLPFFVTVGKQQHLVIPYSF